jgi:hypothetical protein
MAHPSSTSVQLDRERVGEKGDELFPGKDETLIFRMNPVRFVNQRFEVVDLHQCVCQRTLSIHIKGSDLPYPTNYHR